MNKINDASQNLNFLLIEDSKSDALIIEKQLSMAFLQNYTLEIAKTLEDGLSCVAQKKFTLVLLDRSLPDAEGFEGLLSLQNIDPELPIVFITSHQNHQFVSDAIMHGAQDYLIKGKYDEDRIKRAVEFAIFRKKYETILIERANFDLLTGLGNRRLFQNRLNLAIAREKRHGGAFAVAFIDLDKFKEINDTHGHAAGDLVLKEISLRLKEVIRTYDIAARLGGDEFGILFESISCPQDVEVIAKKIIYLFSKPIKILELELTVTASLGITLCDSHQNIESDAVIKHSDQLMYEAKKIKGNSYCIGSFS